LVAPEVQIGDDELTRICDELHDRFAIEHSNLQVERGDERAACDRVRGRV
jgi:hypothetical protein